ncbi:MAG: hypothetical protein WCD86_23450 [Ktedonobacteraceae bacterium]
MKQESLHENESQPSSPAENGPAESDIASTWRMIGKTELVGGSPRPIVDGGLLGVCIAFLIAFLTMQPKGNDTSLSTALIAFAIALPLLAWGFLCTFYKRLKIVPHAGPANIFSAILVGAWVAEGIGWIATYLGILLVIWHLSFPAFIAFVSSSVFILVVLPLLSSIGLGIYAVREYRPQDEQHQETNPIAPGDGPPAPTITQSASPASQHEDSPPK